ncbi:hypothetical protein NDU88_004924 [Pleurodeles waltl]|uniref:Uncharacterized protein n=1 Tax=Pleurodeles waltl TaxID=8319 RepID=A0AAV7SK68_PLEWA|nr:hypothetical protein NDU88_004924 [Pleurodeles waltl]
MGPHWHRTRHTPGAPDGRSFLTRKSSGQDPILRHFQVKTGRKGTLRSGLRKQEEGPEMNETPKETIATSGTEEKTRTDPRTAHKQEDIGATTTANDSEIPVYPMTVTHQSDTPMPHINENLPPKQKEQLEHLIQTSLDVFSKSPDRTQLIQHQIRTIGDKVARQHLIESRKLHANADFLWGVNVTGQHWRQTHRTPGAPDVRSFLTRKASRTGPNPEALPGEDGQSRKGTLRSGPGKQEEEPETNGTPKEMTATSGTEEKTSMDPRTAHEQEDIGAISRHLKEERTRRQYSKTPAMLWEDGGLHSKPGHSKNTTVTGRQRRALLGKTNGIESNKLPLRLDTEGGEVCRMVLRNKRTGDLSIGEEVTLHSLARKLREALEQTPKPAKHQGGQQDRI